MTSTTPIDGLADWLRNGKLGICAAHPEQLAEWACAVESLALERIAVPEGQAELTDAEIEKAVFASKLDEDLWFGKFTPVGYEDRMPKLRAFARAILSARKDRADALLLKAHEQLALLAADADITDEIQAYLKGEAP